LAVKTLVASHWRSLAVSVIQIFCFLQHEKEIRNFPKAPFIISKATLGG